MRILRVITRMNGGGPAKQVVFLHRAFEQSGHFCYLIHGQLDRGEVDFSHLLHNTQHVKQSSFLKRPISALSDLLACIEIFLELCLNPYDVIHSHTAKAGLCSRLAAMMYRPISAFLGRPKLKVCHTFHGHVFSGYFSQSMERKVKKVEAWLWRHTDVPIALTEKLKSEIVAHLNVEGSKMKVVSLGLDLQDYLKPVDANLYNSIYACEFKYWIGWVGRYAPIKNPTYLIEIAKELCQLRTDVGFVMFGEGLMSRELEGMIQRHGLQNQIKLAGWSDDLPRVYAGLSLLLNTSKNEGTPVAVIEALAAGLPVYATDVGGVREVIDCSELNHLLSWNAHESAELIHQNLSQLGRLSDIERNHVVEQFSQKKLYENLKKLYQQHE